MRQWIRKLFSRISQNLRDLVGDLRRLCEHRARFAQVLRIIRSFCDMFANNTKLLRHVCEQFAHKNAPGCGKHSRVILKLFKISSERKTTFAHYLRSFRMYAQVLRTFCERLPHKMRLLDFAIFLHSRPSQNVREPRENPP